MIEGLLSFERGYHQNSQEYTFSQTHDVQDQLDSFWRNGIVQVQVSMS